MKNNKGFTLVELLAMLVVLGILIGVAIPNIVGMVENQRINVYKNDAINMVSLTKNQIAKMEFSEKPGNNECSIFTLKYLSEFTSEIEKGPNGQLYLPYDSIVIYARKNNEYKYYIRLVEQTGTRGVGIALTNYDNLGDFDKSYIKYVNKYGFNENEDTVRSLINDTSNTNTQTIRNVCGTLKTYYK